MAVLIRNVDETRWREFKAEAARRGVTVGELFNEMAAHYLEGDEARKAWERIFDGPKALTDDEAERMLDAIKEFREGFYFDDPP